MVAPPLAPPRIGLEAMEIAIPWTRRGKCLWDEDPGWPCPCFPHGNPGLDDGTPLEGVSIFKMEFIEKWGVFANFPFSQSKARFSCEGIN